MPSNITCSAKILTCAIAPFLFILVDALCEFAMVPGVYILLYPQEEELHYSKHFKPLSKTFNLCLTSYDYAKVIDEIEKTQTRNSAVLWCS